MGSGGVWPARVLRTGPNRCGVAAGSIYASVSLAHKWSLECPPGAGHRAGWSAVPFLRRSMAGWHKRIFSANLRHNSHLSRNRMSSSRAGLVGSQVFPLIQAYQRPTTRAGHQCSVHHRRVTDPPLECMRIGPAGSWKRTHRGRRHSHSTPAPLPRPARLPVPTRLSSTACAMQAPTGQTTK